jgi:subtilase family serine protease
MGYRKALMGAFTTLAAAALALLGATAGVAGGATTAAVQSRSRLATPSSLVASTNGSTNIRFSVGLKMTNRAGAIALEREVSEPASPQYRHYLTPAQWERRFSPSRSSVNAVSEWLTSQGIAVLGVSADHMTIDAQAPASTVAGAFGTSLGEYRRGNADIRLAASSLTVPSAIAPLISGVIGVNQQAASHDSLTGGERATGSAAPSARRTRAKRNSGLQPPEGFMNAPPCSNYYGEKTVIGQPPFGDGFPHPLTWAPCGYIPAQLQGAYNLAGPIAAGIDGAGVTVAIIDAYASPTLLSDAEEYERKNQPSAVLNSTQFTEMLAPTYNEEELCEAPSWAGEQTLDVEAVHATAPGANILYVGAENCLDGGLFGAVQAVVDGGLAQVITDSWGDNGGDLFDAAGEREAFDNVLIHAGDDGIGVQFSSGDEGSNFHNLGINVPDYPTDSPYAISVGGTSLEVSKQNTRISETGWSTSKSYLCTGLLEEAGLPGCTKLTKGTWNPVAPGAYDYGGGGGTSFVYPAPWWQELGEVPASLLARNAPITREANRVIPDISMDADPSTGMKIGETQAFETGTPLVRYGEYRLGGTSLASPLFAGVMADADQAAGHIALGFVDPLLYKLAAESSSPYLTAGSIYDELAAGKQAIERNDYLLPAASEYPYTTVRVLGYEGLEEYCSGTEECEVQNVELHATPGFDSMTGIGSPGPEFLRFAATLKPPTP